MSEESTEESQQGQAQDQTAIALLIGELVNSTTMLFGVSVTKGKTAEETVQNLLDLLNKDNGEYFLPIIDSEIMVDIKYAICPFCETVTSMLEKGCAGCHRLFDDEAFRKKFVAGNVRIVNKTQYTARALMDGTENVRHIRPEHLVTWDTVSPDSLVYRKWKETSAKARKQLAQINSNIWTPP
jgi:hypothetical protein